MIMLGCLLTFLLTYLRVIFYCLVAYLLACLFLYQRHPCELQRASTSIGLGLPRLLPGQKAAQQ